MVDYDNVAILMGELLAAVIPDLRQEASTITEQRGINFELVAHDGVDHKLMARVPLDTDAIFVTGLPRMPQADFDRLIETINAAGIPSYSFVGIQDVRRGVLVTNSARIAATGFAGNQIAAMRREFPKPTFLPVMLDVGVLPSQAGKLP